MSAGGSAGAAGGGGLAAGGTGGGNAGGSSAGGNGAGGGSAGGSSGAAGSAGSGPIGNCGTFGPPQMLFGSPDILSSVSITGDELELFYIVDTRVFVSRRASVGEAFMTATEVPELSALCDTSTTGPSLDVTSDGLRIYMDCADGPTPLYLAERSDRSSPFSVLAEPVGSTGTSISLSEDELTIYTTTTDVDNWQPKKHERASTAEPFGEEMSIPGLVGPLRMLELATDNVSLFGVVAQPQAPTQWRLAVATRATADGPSFNPPVTSGLPDPSILGTAVSDYTPTLNSSCSAIYFMRLTSQTGANLSTIYVMRRQ